MSTSLSLSLPSSSLPASLPITVDSLVGESVLAKVSQTRLQILKELEIPYVQEISDRSHLFDFIGRTSCYLLNTKTMPKIIIELITSYLPVETFCEWLKRIDRVKPQLIHLLKARLWEISALTIQELYQCRIAFNETNRSVLLRCVGLSHFTLNYLNEEALSILNVFSETQHHLKHLHVIDNIEENIDGNRVKVLNGMKELSHLETLAVRNNLNLPLEEIIPFWPNLTHLDFINSYHYPKKPSEDIVKIIAIHCCGLRTLKFPGCLSDSIIQDLVSNCRQLKAIGFDDCREATKEGLTRLINHYQLTEFRSGVISSDTIPDRGFGKYLISLHLQYLPLSSIECLVKSSPLLQSLKLRNNHLKGEGGLSALKYCPELTEIDISGGLHLTNNALSALATCRSALPYLRLLNLKGCRRLTREKVQQFIRRWKIKIGGYHDFRSLPSTSRGRGRRNECNRSQSSGYRERDWIHDGFIRGRGRGHFRARRGRGEGASTT